MSTQSNSEPDYTIRMPGSVDWKSLDIDPILATHEEILSHAPTVQGDYNWIRFTSILPAVKGSLAKGIPSLRLKLQTRCAAWNKAFYDNKVTISVSTENLDRALQKRLHSVYMDILYRNGAIDLRSINFDDTPGLFLSSNSWEKLVYNMGYPGQDGLNHPSDSEYKIKEKFEFLHVDLDSTSNRDTISYAPTRMQILKVFLAGAHSVTRSSESTNLEPFALVQCHHAGGEDHRLESRYAVLSPKSIVCSKSLDTLLCRQRYEALGFLIDKSL